MSDSLSTPLRPFLPAMLLVVIVATGNQLPAAEPATPAPATVTAATPGHAVDMTYREQVAPILKRHCAECHAGEEPEAGLDLSNRLTLLRGGDSGPALFPGSAGKSLIAQLVAKDSDPHMPPDGQLTDQEIATLSKWIDQLPPAAKPSVITPEDRQHWAFQPMRSPEIPQTPGASDNPSPIDALVIARLRERGLKLSEPASQEVLIRRAYYDLIGLPPTPEQVAEFVEDSSPQAFAAVVDRLLASPAYGERWGRHWLDLARYADSGGFHNDLDRPSAWRYRDYVIQSLNADKPYAQFVGEQLAGDEIDPTNPDALVATGFCRNGPSNDDQVREAAREMYRLEELDDVISTTGTVFLGLTIGCARCHDHKYDPIPQEDYYRLLAIFNTTTKRNLPLPGIGGVAADGTVPKGTKLAPADTALAITDTGSKPRPTSLLWRGNHKTPGPEVEPGVPQVLVDAPIDFPVPQPGDSTTGRRAALAAWITSPDNPLTWRVLANRVWQHHFGQGLVATTSNFGRSGDTPSHPELLDWLALELVSGGGRLKSLHRQILLSRVWQQSSRFDPASAEIDPDNRLLWRQNKQRLEAEPLRDSILAVSGNLNPTAGGPGIKPRIATEILARSKRNQWPVVKQEGPQHWRRSVYIYIKRQMLMPMMELFDAPTSATSCGERSRSTVPTQALALLNNDFVNDQARYFSRRVQQDAGDDAAAQAERALWLALARTPSAARIAEATEFLREQRQSHAAAGKSTADARHAALSDLCHVLFNCSQFLYVD